MRRTGRFFGESAPSVVSQRHELRRALPPIFQEDDLGMRFVGALETVLDPIAALLDSLSSHFDPATAPPDIVRLLASWVGVDVDERLSDFHQRELVRRAADLGRLRGTVAGVELALGLAFPDLPLRVVDRGGVVWGDDAAALSLAVPSGPAFDVYSDQPIGPDVWREVVGCIERVAPVGAAFRRRVPLEPGSHTDRSPEIRRE